MYNNNKLYKKAEKQATVWKYLAWSLPIIWLAAEFLLNVFGFQSLENRMLVAGGIFFFVVSVIWWWWAVDTIRLFAKSMQRTTDNFNEIKDELRKVREDINK